MFLAIRLAAAFCGTYVGAAEDPLTNAVSEVAMVRLDDRTTLTIANDVHGDPRDFALVVPVPEVLPEDAIHVVAPEVFDRLDAYSAPRSVSYECEDFEAESDADTDADTDADADTDVDVESEYIVGEYDVKILSATESGSLVGWLRGNGYRVPDASATLLGEYVTSGAYFFAAQVRADAGVVDGQTLSPLQFSYTTPLFGLPIRIGTLNSPGSQDLRLYAITSTEAGSVGIGNYSEAIPENDCMWCGDDFAAFYGRVIDDAISGAEARWIEEFAGGYGGCDPCSDTPPSHRDLVTLGWPAERSDWFLTRLRMRYTPGQAVRDLSMYTTRDASNRQLKYVVYDGDLEDRFPVCFVGYTSFLGTCDDAFEREGWSSARVCDEQARRLGAKLPGGGCDGCAGGSGSVAAILLFGARSRRRQPMANS